MDTSINVDLLRDNELKELLPLVKGLREATADSPYAHYQGDLFVLLEGVLLTEIANRRSRRRKHQAAIVSFEMFRAWPLDALEATWGLLRNFHEEIKRDTSFEAEFFAKALAAISEERIARDQINRI
jgi:hypothetical protein